VSRIAVIYNPVAGEGSARQVLEEWMDFVAGRYHHEEMVVWATEGQNHALMLAEKGYRLGIREFVCIGGDGTFHEMCQPLVGQRDVRVALVPVGTGNDLAVGLGFSRTFRREEWTDFFLGEATLIDVGQCNERYFFNTMGIGFDALVASEFRRCSWIPRRWRYYPPIVKHLLSYRGYPLTMDGERLSVFLLSIGNGRFSGGGVPLTPSAKIDDGWLDMCLIEDVGPWKRVQNLFRALKGKHTSLPFVHTRRIKTLTLSADQNCVTHMDGEIFSLDRWHITIHPQALPVYVPRKSLTL